MQHELIHRQGYILGGLTHRVETLEEAQGKMRKDLEQLRVWCTRIAILATLWSAAIGTHLSRDQASDVLAALLKSLLGAALKM